MTFTESALQGCFIIEPKVLKDDRGYFMESYNLRTFQDKTGITQPFVQDNQSFSTKGVLRGLHYQTGEHAQAKLVRVIQGEVLDVAVDIRPNSPTFGKYESVLLTGENQKQFYIPRGFAHGFLVLSDTALFFYKCDNFYNKESEGGIIYSDASIGIDWKMNLNELLVSEKDAILPELKNSKPVW